ncbi:hypothetical protein [Streptomyces phaeolivaceus]|uniref:hypothetical protein n=1 Tax=Streptomyces phaeolivaceus TaxID=2653200 RepID=UPI001D048EB5|nr:hypothetical protein [Streptomyces phaeolivaceus]
MARARWREWLERVFQEHRDDPQLLRVMIEEASFSQDLLDAIERHGRDRVEQVRELLGRHPDVRARFRSRRSRTSWWTWSPAICAVTDGRSPVTRDP